MTVDMEYPKDWGLQRAYHDAPKFRPETYYPESDDLLRVRYVIDYGVFADFQKARKPAATWGEVQPLELSEEKIDELVKQFPDQPFFHIVEDTDEQRSHNEGEPTTGD
jgi:hypothetical protein